MKGFSTALVVCFFFSFLNKNYPPVSKHSWLENPPFVDVFPIGKGGFPASYVRLQEGFFYTLAG